MNRLPHFLIIGAGKSGTTSLDFYLKQHPQVFMPDVKEPNFFAYESHNINDFDDEETRNHFTSSITKVKDYQALFEKASPNQLIGEVSNTTMYMPNAIASIKSHLKAPKLVAILRNPAERLFSRYMHLERVSKVPNTSLDNVFDRHSVWWNRADLINEGFYFNHLSKFYENFNRDSLSIILYNDFKKDINSVLKNLCVFLEIDDTFVFDTSTVYNKSGKVKSKTIQKLVGDNSRVFRSFKSSFPKAHATLKNSPVIKSAIQSLRNKNLTKANFPIELKQRIIEEIYLDDIKALERLIHRDLSSWYQFDKV